MQPNLQIRLDYGRANLASYNLYVPLFRPKQIGHDYSWTFIFSRS